MIPFRDENPTRTFPLFVVLLILANVIVYLYQSLLPEAQGLLFVYKYSAIPTVLFGRADVMDSIRVTQPDAYAYFAHYGIQASQLQPTWLSIFTAMFLHGSWLHIGSNMLYLWVFGNNIEDTLGHFGFLVFYFACGLIAAAAQIVMSLHSPVPMLGASGAIAGVLGAYYVLFPRARVSTLIFIFFFVTVVALPASVLLFLWFIIQVVQSVGSIGLSGTQGGVAVFAHVGGFVAGWIIVRLLAPRRPRPQTISWD